MTRYALRRLVLLPILLFIFSAVVFAIVQAPPGDFLTAYMATLASSGSSVSAEQFEALRKDYGLDQPRLVRYQLRPTALVTMNTRHSTRKTLDDREAKAFTQARQHRHVARAVHITQLLARVVAVEGQDNST